MNEESQVRGCYNITFYLHQPGNSVGSPLNQMHRQKCLIIVIIIIIIVRDVHVRNKNHTKTCEYASERNTVTTDECL